MKYIKLKHSILFGIPLMLAVLGIYLVVEFGIDLVSEDEDLKTRMSNIESSMGDLIVRMIEFETKQLELEKNQEVKND